MTVHCSLCRHRRASALNKGTESAKCTKNPIEEPQEATWDLPMRINKREWYCKDKNKNQDCPDFECPNADVTFLK